MKNYIALAVFLTATLSPASEQRPNPTKLSPSHIKKTGVILLKPRDYQTHLSPFPKFQVKRLYGGMNPARCSAGYVQYCN